MTSMQCQDLIEIMKQKGNLTLKNVEDAIRDTPRHLFVSDEYFKEAYYDEPIPTKNHQTISQPSVVARMTEWLDVKPDDKILEIGCGSGWQSAILSKLAFNGRVYSIERHSNLVKFAQENHKKAGVTNVEVIEGDGTLGISDKAPFDKIIITAACEEIPPVVIEQLVMEGLIIAPVGKNVQNLILYKKAKDVLKEIKNEYGYVFVPLVGK